MMYKFAKSSVLFRLMSTAPWISRLAPCQCKCFPFLRMNKSSNSASGGSWHCKHVLQFGFENGLSQAALHCYAHTHLFCACELQPGLRQPNIATTLADLKLNIQHHMCFSWAFAGILQQKDCMSNPALESVAFFYCMSIFSLGSFANGVCFFAAFAGPPLIPLGTSCLPSCFILPAFDKVAVRFDAEVYGQLCSEGILAMAIAATSAKLYISKVQVSPRKSPVCSGKEKKG